jgi:hypothetical protein
MSQYIALRHTDGTFRKITKIGFYPDGGLFVMAPYHEARSGLLYKFRPDYSKRSIIARLDETLSYTADDKVKLSFHGDGFLQFSGLRSHTIISGRDEKRRPKGLGIIGRPPSPIFSGPAFGVMAWGLEDYEILPDGKAAVRFEQADVYSFPGGESDLPPEYLQGAPQSKDAFEVCFFLNRINELSAVQHQQGFPTVDLLYSFNGVQRYFRQRVIRSQFDKANYFLGVCVIKRVVRFASASGFSLSSPSFSQQALHAIYPRELSDSQIARSLNYRKAS